MGSSPACCSGSTPCQYPGCPQHPLLNPTQPHPGHFPIHLLRQLPLPPASQGQEALPPGSRSFWTSCCQEGEWLRAEAKPSFMQLQLGRVPRVGLWFHKGQGVHFLSSTRKYPPPSWKAPWALPQGLFTGRNGSYCCIISHSPNSYLTFSQRSRAGSPWAPLQPNSSYLE